MKNTLKILLFIPIIFLFIGSLKYIEKENNNKIAKSNLQSLDNSKEEYIYKDQLLDLGYTIKEISTIENKLSTLDVKKYLLQKKYNDIEAYLVIPYFKCKNIERYNNYRNKNNNLNLETIVTYVEIGLDKDFYSEIIEVTNYNDKTVLVNKYNKLPENYEAEDLVTLPNEYGKDMRLKSEASQKVIELMDNAKKENISLNIISAYRTEDRQNYLFENSEKKNGLKHALKYSAKKGHSEHQTGYAIDFNTTQEKFSKTKEYAWLKENAYKYGFIERYPKGKESITGFGYEPWHYRYVGIDIATKIYIENITYEEYVVEYLK